MTTIVPCPLPPTSDLPFSWEALRAWNERARLVLDDRAPTAVPPPPEDVPMPEFTAAVITAPTPKQTAPGTLRRSQIQKQVTADVAHRVERVTASVASGTHQREACWEAGISRGQFNRAVRSLKAGATIIRDRTEIVRKPRAPRAVRPLPSADDPQAMRRFWTRLYSRWKYQVDHARPDLARFGPPRLHAGRLTISAGHLPLLRPEERAALFRPTPQRPAHAQ